MGFIGFSAQSALADSQAAHLLMKDPSLRGPQARPAQAARPLATTHVPMQDAYPQAP